MRARQPAGAGRVHRGHADAAGRVIVIVGRVRGVPIAPGCGRLLHRNHRSAVRRFARAAAPAIEHHPVQPIAVRAAATRPPRSQVGLDDLARLGPAQVAARQAPVAAQAARQDGPPAPAQGRAALALPCHHQRAGAARHHPAGARRAAGQLGGRLRGVATPVYSSADCIPNKDCMRTWFEGGATTVKKVGVHNCIHSIYILYHYPASVIKI